MKFSTAASEANGPAGAPESVMLEAAVLTPTIMSLALAGSPVLTLLFWIRAKTSMSSLLAGAPAVSANPANALAPG